MNQDKYAQLESGLRRIVAPNPSPMTQNGTNTYLVGTGQVAVIDPGPGRPDHLDAILAALEPGERITHVFVTHSHLDHSPLARPLAKHCDAPVLAFGASHDGRSKTMEILAKEGNLGGGEGVDHDFLPDEVLTDGAIVESENWSLCAIHTPGHLSNHLCFAWGDRLFSGDHVMGWATSVVSPPDGDLGAFMRSCEKLQGRKDRVYYPGHGDPIPDPAQRLQWLIDHRRGREAEILGMLAERRHATPAELTAIIYTDVDKRLHQMAERNVLAHLIDLSERALVTPIGPLSSDAAFQRQ